MRRERNWGRGLVRKVEVEAASSVSQRERAVGCSCNCTAPAGDVGAAGRIRSWCSGGAFGRLSVNCRSVGQWA